MLENKNWMLTIELWYLCLRNNNEIYKIIYIEIKKALIMYNSNTNYTSNQTIYWKQLFRPATKVILFYTNIFY